MAVMMVKSGYSRAHQAVDGQDLTGHVQLEVNAESEEGTRMTPKGLLAKDAGWCYHSTQHGSMSCGEGGHSVWVDRCALPARGRSHRQAVCATVALNSIPGRWYEWRAGPWGAVGRECVVSEGRVQS